MVDNIYNILETILSKNLNIWLFNYPNMVKIGELSIQNPWWRYGKNFIAYDKSLSPLPKPIFFVRRSLEPEINNIYVIRGSRQVGKTTYLKDMIRNLIYEDVDSRKILYLSLDFFTSRREMRSAIEYFLSVNRDADRLYIFLDEITSIKDWNLELKYLSDVGITKKASIITTGSSGMILKKNVELLPGRGLEGNEYYMKPLSFREFVLQCIDYIRSSIGDKEFCDTLKLLRDILRREDAYIDLDWNISKIYDTANMISPYIGEVEYLFNIYLVTGGFPQSINSYLRNFDDKTIDSSLAEVFVRNVLGDISKVGKQEIYAKRILREIIDRYGTRYSFRSLASAIESTHTTALEYLETLVESFILTIIYSYDINLKKVMYKGDKKIYLQDPFIYYSLQSYLKGIDLNDVIEKTVTSEEVLARLIEGLVGNHLMMTRERPLMKSVETFLWFYYNHRGREIDYIMETGKGYTALEVKYQRNVDYKDMYRVSHIKKYIVLSKEDIGMKNNILIIPTPIFLLLLRKNHYNL